jgi:hypothetical protein
MSAGVKVVIGLFFAMLDREESNVLCVTLGEVPRVGFQPYGIELGKQKRISWQLGTRYLVTRHRVFGN